MPVIARGADVEVKSYHNPPKLLSPEDVLARSCQDQYRLEFKGMIDSSFSKDGTPIVPAKNGLVQCAIDAYERHHHLVLRPEDVWFAVLTQFAFYVNKHSEALRSYFVDHAGKKKLEIETDDLNPAMFVQLMADMIHDNIKRKDMKDWIMPSFTTTTQTDRVAASIIMMGTMQNYFVYFNCVTCGIPSATLLGERSDWVDLLGRLDFLKTFDEKDHPQLHTWHDALKPVFEGFVRSFDEPDSEDVQSFWQNTVNYMSGCDGDIINGWLVAFCFFDTKGNFLFERVDRTDWNAPDGAWRKLFVTERHPYPYMRWMGLEKFEVDIDVLPSGYAHVPVHIDDRGDKFVAIMLAGSVGYRVLNSKTVRERISKHEEISQTKKIKKGKTAISVRTTSTDSVVGGQTAQGSQSKSNPLRRVLQSLCCMNPKIEHSPSEKAALANDLLGASSSSDTTGPGVRDTVQPVVGWWSFESKGRSYGV